MLGLTAEYKRATQTKTFKAIDEARQGLLSNRLCIEVPSTSASETHEWLGQMPEVKEFFDERSIEGLKKWEFIIKNRHFETTLGFKKKELDDNPEIVAPMIPGMALTAAEHFDELMFDVLALGESALCFDGKALFANDHPLENGGSFDNLLSGSGVTAANIATDFNAWVAMAKAITKRNGHPLIRNIGKPVILHSPALEAVMRLRFKMPTYAGGETNDLFDQAEPIACGELTGNDWYPVITSRPMKPFVLQNRENWKFRWEDSEATIFHTGMVYYGGDARYNIGMGHPALIAKVDNT